MKALARYSHINEKCRGKTSFVVVKPLSDLMWSYKYFSHESYMVTLTFKQAKNVFIKRYHLQYNIFNLSDTEVIAHIYNNALLKKKDGGNIS